MLIFIAINIRMRTVIETYFGKQENREIIFNDISLEGVWHHTEHKALDQGFLVDKAKGKDYWYMSRSTRVCTAETNYKEYNEQLRSLGAEKFQIMKTLVWESRLTITTIILAGYGRANAEVGAVMIVGGNINHATRVMTTTIAHETGKGNLILALSLGIILILIAFLINFTMQKIESISEQE